jgi:GDP-L-fucose synthase
LVTGGSGLVGTALGGVLARAGYADVALVSSADADLRSRTDTFKLFERVQPSVVFHLAARVYGLLGNMHNRGAVFSDNIRINTNVIDACRECGVKKVIAMGSTAVYSDQVPTPMSEGDIWIGPPHESESAYAHTKRMMLAHLETYASEGGPRFAFAVSTNLYGPSDRFDEAWGHVIPSLISKFNRAATQGGDVEIWGSGKATRDFLYSEDAAHALRIIGERGEGTINLATGKTTTIRAVVDLLRAVSDYHGNVRWDGTKPDGQLTRQYDVSRLRALGFEPQSSLKDGLRRTYQWFEKNFDTARR